MNLDHLIFFPMYSVAIRDSSLLVGVEYWWRILPKVSFYILIMRSVSSFVNLMKRVLGQVPTAVRHLDNSNCILVFWLRVIEGRHSTQFQHKLRWTVEFAKLCYTSFLLHTLGCFRKGLWIWFDILHGLQISCCYWKVLNFETSTGVR